MGRQVKKKKTTPQRKKHAKQKNQNKTHTPLGVAEKKISGEEKNKVEYRSEKRTEKHASPYEGTENTPKTILK